MPRVPSGARLFRLVAAVAACCCLTPSVAAQGQVGRVPGVVRNEQGEPVTGAAIVAENPRATPHLFRTTTDEGGAFVLVGLAAGPWSFSASAAGYAPLRLTVQLPKGSKAPVVELVVKKGAWEPPSPEAGRLAGVNVFRLQTTLRNAEALMRAGEYDLAIAAYRDVLAQAPALSRANLAIGDAWRMKKEFERAIGAYRDALASEPDNEMAMVGIAGAEIERGGLAEAEKVLAGALSRPRPGREVLCMLGDVKLAQQQHEEAVRWYHKAAAADPAWARPIMKLGLLAASRHDADAVGLLEKAMRLAPGSSEAAESARVLAGLRK
jgi:Flp pilus assembly protein TadD